MPFNKQTQQARRPDTHFPQFALPGVSLQNFEMGEWRNGWNPCCCHGPTKGCDITCGLFWSKDAKKWNHALSYKRCSNRSHVHWSPVRPLRWDKQIGHRQVDKATNAFVHKGTPSGSSVLPLSPYRPGCFTVKPKKKMPQIMILLMEDNSANLLRLVVYSII